MKKARFWGVTLCACLLSASAAQAVISDAVLERPAQGETGSGKNVIAGHACDSGGKTVTVRARVDGVTLTNPEVIIPSGGLRQDVTACPDLLSGFSYEFNYGTAFSTVGPHMIGVEISAPGETPVIIDHGVTVLRLGNSSFVGNIDLSGATCSLQGNTILLNNASVVPNQGSPVTTTLGSQFTTNNQGLIFTSDTSNQVSNTFTANVNGSQEVPPPTSLTCTGTGTLTLNRSDNTITCNLTFGNLTGDAIAAHIHQDPPGEAGDVILGICTTAPCTSPLSCPAGASLTAAQVTALDQGNLYFNIHTSANMAGECRGQIVAGP